MIRAPTAGRRASDSLSLTPGAARDDHAANTNTGAAPMIGRGRIGREAIGRRSLMKGLAGLGLTALAAGRARAAGEQSHTGEPPTHGPVQLTSERVLGQSAIPVYRYRVVKVHPHDTSSYTEGFVLEGGSIYEGTGLYGRSRLIEWDLASGRVLRERALDPNVFGEGVTVMGERIYQLTYLDNHAYVYDRRTFERIGAFRYTEQGWGMTHNGTHLITSNGSSSIVFRDPATFERVRTIFVSDAVAPLGFLNELEYADGKLYANVWQSPFIAIIDPVDGRMLGWIDLSGLNPDPAKLVYPYVLNGIAFDKATGHLLVTGKCWPHVWEIALDLR